MEAQKKYGIGYIRVSTIGQTIEGISLESQESAIRKYCQANDVELANIFIDAGLSGKTVARPALQHALRDCPKGGAIVVYSLSRLSRSVQDTLTMSDDLQARGIDLVSLTEKIDTATAIGKMFFQFCAMMAEFERNQISERTKAALAELKSQGRRTGAVPFGYRVDDNKMLLPDPGEQKVIAEIARYRAKGWSYQRLIQVAIDCGVPPRGKQWNKTTIQRICESMQ